MDRSSRKHRDSDRDSHNDSTKKDHKHRTTKHTDDHHRSKHRDTAGDDRRRRSERERSEDVEDRVKRERSYDREGSKDRELREKSVDNRRHHKRKDRGDSEDEDRYNEVRDKRNRVSDERKERRRFEVKVAAAEDERDREERKERRRFEDRVKKEEMDFDGSDGGKLQQRSLNGETMKMEPEDEAYGVSSANGDALGLRSKALGTPHETSLVPSHPPSKVSLISTKNENEGVNSNRSHEVPGKSSTDGKSSDAGKSGGISLDALSKAKATLLKRKELAEKMKKIPLLNKGADAGTDRSDQMSAKEGVKIPFGSVISLGPPQPVSTSAQASLSGSTASLQPLGSGVPQLAGLTAPKFEAVKRAQELAAKMGFRQDPEFAPLLNMFPGQMPPEVIVQPKPAKAPVLCVDALGREIDEHGNVVNIPKLNNLSTLKMASRWSMSTKHNICAHLNLTSRNAAEFTGIIIFLRRSRIFRAISAQCTPYRSIQQSFWENAVVDRSREPYTIRSSIFGQDIELSEDDIRTVLEFGDDAGCPTRLHPITVRGCFMRAKYSGDINSSMLNKSNLCPQFKYLAHVLLRCIASRKGGFDELSDQMQNAFAALVLNFPFSFSRIIFTYLVENIEAKGKESFCMYPRFIQMIIDQKLPQLPKAQEDAVVLEIMDDTTLGRMKVYRGKQVKPPVSRLFGHLAREDYVAPARKKWRHDDSDSDVEQIALPSDYSDGDDHDTDQGGDGQGGSGETVTDSSYIPDSLSSRGGAFGFRGTQRKRLAQPHGLKLKRRRFTLLTTSTATTTTSVTTTTTTTPTTTPPLTTTTPPTTTISPPIFTTTTTPPTTSAPPPIFTTTSHQADLSSFPTRSSLPPIEVKVQLATLNQMVLKLLAVDEEKSARLHQLEKHIAQQAEQISQLQEQHVMSTQKIKDLESANKKILLKLKV